MKHLFLLAFFFGAAQTVLHAQSVVNSSALKSTSAHQAKKNVVHESTSHRAVLNNRKIYHWKNGQRATPTGHQATGSNTDAYVSLKKDSSSQSAGVKH